MPDWLGNLLGLAAGGGIGAYVAIRADLAALMVKAEIALESANSAHGRIDQHLQSEREKK